MSAKQTVQLRRLFRVVNGGTPTADEDNWGGGIQWATPVDLGRVHGGVLDGTDRTLSPVGLRTGSTAVPGGSLVVSTRAPIGYVAQASTLTAFNQGCRGLVPRRPLDVRFYRYVIVGMTEQLQGAGQGSTFVELSGDALAQQRVPMPPLHTQRGIAAFLDTETARIDALITKKRRMIDLLDERRADGVETAIRGLGTQYGVQPLKRSVEAVTVGIVVTPSEWYGGHGVLALRGLNVRPGSIDTVDVVYLTDEGHRLHKKSELHAGDVVVVRTGQAGAAVVVPPELHGSNCVDLLIVRPGSMDPTFLSFVLNSDWTQKHIANHSVGSIQSHFNVGALRELPVPAAPVKAQVSVSARLQADAMQHLALRSRLERQLALLQEHRQALITAAVTGELEVPGVAA